MKIFLFKNDQQFGPYSLEDVQQLLQSGVYTAIDSAWYEGCEEWTTISHLPGIDIAEEARQRHLVPPFEAYVGDKPYVFVSYSHQDGELVFREIRKLHEAGYRIWYDEGIDPGNDWPEHIANAVINCDLFLMFTSPRSAASENCRNEVNLALNRKKKFLSVYLEETILPPGLELRMGDLQAIMKFKMSAVTYRKKLFMGLEGMLPEDGRDVPEGADPAAAAMAIDVGAEYLSAPELQEDTSLRGVGKAKRKALWIGLAVVIISSLGAGWYFIDAHLKEKEASEQAAEQTKLESAAKFALTLQHYKLVVSILNNEQVKFESLLDSSTRSNPLKINLAWIALHLGDTLLNMKKEDFRIDEISFDDEITKAMVKLSYRVNGQWEMFPYDLKWVLEDSEWRLKP